MGIPVHLAKVAGRLRTGRIGINVSLIPSAVRRWERARLGKDPCSVIGLNFGPAMKQRSSEWNRLLDELLAFGESFRPRSKRKKSRRAKH